MPAPETMLIDYEKLVKESVELLAKHTGKDANEKMAIPVELMEKARGVAFLYLHQVSAGASVSGGQGLLVPRKPGSQEWGLPIMLGLGGVGAGLQIGYSKEYQICLLMTDDAVRMLTRDNVRYAADLSVAAGPHGRHMEDATHFASDGAQKEKVHAYSYGYSEGLHIGAGFKGQMVTTQDEANGALYGVKIHSEGGPKAEELVFGDVLAGKEPSDMTKLLQGRLTGAGQEV